MGARGLAARAGVVTGEVAVNLGAIGEGMVAGDMVNTAARVQTTAQPGQVLVDGTTLRLSRSAVMFSSAGAHVLKGKADAVELWRAERVVSNVGGGQRVDGLESPLVGRDAEMRLIKELFHAGVDRGTPRLVSVTGIAGVGKSRLGWEFEKYLDGLAIVVNWHRGRCLAYGTGVAYWALAEMVRQRLGIAEEDPVDVAGARLSARLVELVPDPATRAFIAPRLERLLGIERGGAAAMDQADLFAGWRLFFEQLAGEAPVVMLVEDLHHADDGLLDFLAHIIDWARNSPIFVLTFGRSELADTRPHWGSGRGGTTLVLEPLDDGAMTAMLNGLVADLPKAAATAIAEQAEGIPLYAVETVRMLVDRDVIRPVEGRYRLVGDVGELRVPDSLQSLLAARLDSLLPDVRALVADAAVLGSTFPVESLIALSGRPIEEVRPILDDLLRREVFSVRADPLSPERGQYGFVQTMLRQVAYDTLSRRERKARHLAVADHLANAFSGGGEDITEVVAGHLLDALHAVPSDPDVPELRERAAAALEHAGERAVRTGAPAAAARLFAQAASVREASGTDDAALAAAGIRERGALQLRVSGAAHESAAEYRRAQEVYLRLGEPRRAAMAAVGAIESLDTRRVSAEEVPAMLAELGKAVDVLSADADADTVKALQEYARVKSFVGQPDEATALYHRGLTISQDLGLGDQILAGLLSNYAITMLFLRRPVEGAAFFREALLRADAVGDAVLAARISLNLAELLATSDPATAADLAQRSIAPLRRIGARGLLGFAYNNVFSPLVLLGRWDEADECKRDADADGCEEPYLWVGTMQLDLARGNSAALEINFERAATLLAGSGDTQDSAAFSAARAMLALDRGELRECVAYVDETLDFAGQVGLTAETMRWAWPAGTAAALRLGDHSEVERLLGWLGDKPTGHVPPVLRADAALVRAELAMRRAGADPAADEEAVDIARRAALPYQLAQALVNQAEHLVAAGERELAEPLAAEARAIAERLQTAPLLDRLGRLTQPANAEPA